VTEAAPGPVTEPRSPQPSWATGGEALQLWFAPTTLRKTLKIAAVVGTIPSLINQGSVIFGGEATAITWLRVGLNYLVPILRVEHRILVRDEAPRPRIRVVAEQRTDRLLYTAPILPARARSAGMSRTRVRLRP
jgi:hypothetical protein